MSRRLRNDPAVRVSKVAGRPGQTVMIFGSYAPSLVNVRGALIEDAVKSGHKVVAVGPQMDESTAAALRSLGAEPVELNVTNTSVNPFNLLSGLRQFRCVVRKYRPDVLFSFAVKPVIIAALAGRAERVSRIVSLVTGLGYAFTGGNELRRRVSRLVASTLYRAAFRRSDVVLFENPDDERHFRDLGLVSADTPTKVVNGCGIDLEQFCLTPLPVEPSFLMIARLLKDKGVREFEAAVRRVKRELPDARVTLVGYLDPSPDSITEADLAQLIDAGVDFEGRLDDVRPAIGDCSVYVLPSYREGLPRSILEAMAMGRPIITTDAPGCRETVEHGGNGLLVPPRDAEALYEAMMHLAGDPALREAMGRVSRQLAETKYDIHRVNRSILEAAGL